LSTTRRIEMVGRLWPRYKYEWKRTNKINLCFNIKIITWSILAKGSLLLGNKHPSGGKAALRQAPGRGNLVQRWTVGWNRKSCLSGRCFCKLICLTFIVASPNPPTHCKIDKKKLSWPDGIPITY
jgi:hypothetical protein